MATGPAAGPDLGPEMLHARGEIARERRADPDRPRVVVGGVRDGLRVMYARRLLTDQEWAAIEAFRRDCEMAAGGREREDNAGIRAVRRDYGPTELQIDAQARMRRTLDVVGLQLGGVFGALVTCRGTLARYAADHGIGKERARDMLRTALDRLVWCYRGRV